MPTWMAPKLPPPAKTKAVLTFTRLLFRAHRVLNYAGNGIVGSVMHA